MIVDFSVKNFGPFKERATLSMQGTSIREHPEMLCDVDAVNGGLLRSAFIFGANAAGKSYLVEALSVLRDMVHSPFREGYRYEWYQPFRLCRESLDSPTELRIRMIIDGILYDYSISYNADSVVSESLHHYPKRSRACVFLRTGPKEYKDKKSKKRIQALTTSSSAYLATASDYNDRICSIVRNGIEEIIILDSRTDVLVDRACRYASENPGAKEMVLEGLRIADFGISDFVQEGEEVSLSEIRGRIPPVMYEDLVKSNKDTLTRTRTSIKHDFEDYDVDEADTYFPIELESSGTKCMLGMMGPVVDALSHGRALVIDEFGSYLHPIIVRWLVEQFSASGNPDGAQLIAVTHNTELIDKDLLRRDQIWFVDKDRRSGSSQLYSLSDFNGVRKDSDIRKSYLFGRFDAIPEILPRNVIQ